MGSDTGIYILTGILAGFAGYYVWTQSDLFGGMVALFAAGWFIFRFSSYEMAWNTLGYLTHPLRAGIFALLIGVVYYAVNGNPWPGNLTFGIGTAMIGVVVGILLYGFWDLA